MFPFMEVCYICSNNTKNGPVQEQNECCLQRETIPEEQ